MGNKTLEVSLNLNGGTFGQIKLRKFSADDLAFRYGTSVSYDYEKPSKDASGYSLIVSFAPGVEKHFAGTKRLSPYLGFAVPLAFRTAHFESEAVEITGAPSSSSSNYNRGYIALGLNGVAGADLYVAKNFYVGFEVGTGLSYRKYSKVEVKYKHDFSQNEISEGHHGISFNTFTSGGLRVGFAF